MSKFESINEDPNRPSGTLVRVIGWDFEGDIGLFIKTFQVSAAPRCYSNADREELDRLQNEHVRICDCDYPSQWHHKILIHGETQLFNTSSYVLVNAG